MAERGLQCKLLLYTFLFPCVQNLCSSVAEAANCYVIDQQYVCEQSPYDSWYLWFGVAWVVIIGFGLCLGIYRRHRIRQMQINHTNRVVVCRSARHQLEHDSWKGAPGYHAATGPPPYEGIPRYPSAAPPPYPGSPDMHNEQIPSNNYYNPSYSSPPYSPPPATAPSGGHIAYPPPPTPLRF